MAYFICIGIAGICVLAPRRFLLAAYILVMVNLEAFVLTEGPPRISYELITTALVALRLAPSVLRRGDVRAAKAYNWALTAFAPFLVACAMSCVVSISPDRSLKALSRYCTYPFLFVGFARWASEVGPTRVRKYVLLSAIAPTTLALMQFFVPGFMPGSRDWKPESFAFTVGADTLALSRINGTLNSANALGLYLLIIVAVTLAYRTELSRSTTAPLIDSYAVALGLVQFLTLSRSAWFGLLFLLSGWAVLTRRARILGPAALVLLVASVVGSVTGLTTQRLENLQGSRNSLTWRLSVWEGLLSVPTGPAEVLFGHGLDTVVLNNVVQPGFRAHNTFLAFYHDCGLLGVGALVFLFAYSLMSAAGAYRRAAAGVARDQAAMSVFLILVFSVVSITEEPLTVPTVAIYFWITLILNRLPSERHQTRRSCKEQQRYRLTTVGPPWRPVPAASKPF